MGKQNNGRGYFYTIEVALTAATLTATSTSPAQPIGSFPFEWLQLGAYWNATNGDWQMRISDNGANQFFSSQEFPINALVGDVDQKPFELPEPYTFDKGSAIMVEATNNGTGTDTLYLVFIGRRLPSAAIQ